MLNSLLIPISTVLFACAHASVIKISRPIAVLPERVYYNPESHQIYRRSDQFTVENTAQPILVKSNENDETNYQPIPQQGNLNFDLYPYISLQLPNRENSYDFYSSQRLPGANDYQNEDDEEIKYLQEFHPPPESNEPNYYAIKPKKSTIPKKYVPEKKQINLKQKSIKLEKNDNLEKLISSPSEENEKNVEIAERNDRIDYQVHGFDGPKSYKFGYDTAKIVNFGLRKETETEM